MPEEKFTISIKCENCGEGWFHPWVDGYKSWGKEAEASDEGTPFDEIKCDYCGRVYELHEIYGFRLYKRHVVD
jgi:hypothetical protein